MNAYSITLRTRLFNYPLAHSIRKTAELFRVSPAPAGAAKSITPEDSQGYFQHAEDFSLEIS